MFRIPDAVQPPAAVDNFNRTDLQAAGLLNDGNYCSLISLIISLHRMMIKTKMNLAWNQNIIRNPVTPLGFLAKILSVMPSQQPFSLQNFVSCWNDFGIEPPILQNDDISSLADGIIKDIPLKRLPANSPPVFTQYLARLDCQCGHSELMKMWDGQSFTLVPTIAIPRLDSRCNIEDLLQQFLTETFNVRCPNCNNLSHDHMYEVVKGQFTVLTINRRPDYNDSDHTKIMTKLDVTPDSANPVCLTENLICAVNHIGGIGGGHWISYSRCDSNNVWYLNDDSKPVSVSCHPFLASNQTVNYVVYLNKNF